MASSTDLHSLQSGSDPSEKRAQKWSNILQNSSSLLDLDLSRKIYTKSTMRPSLLRSNMSFIVYCSICNIPLYSIAVCGPLSKLRKANVYSIGNSQEINRHDVYMRYI
jgi:hypothetical protein